MRRQIRAGVGCLTLLLVLIHMPAEAARRVALVIGNDAYIDLPSLNNAGTDARGVAAKLRQLGFDVILKLDIGRRNFGRAIAEFETKLGAADVGLVFYAGHGIQAGGRNYLIPANARVEVEDDLPYEGVDSGHLLDAMKRAGSRLNIVIMDACRDNPLPRRSRSTARGLTVTAVPSGIKGTAIVYSAAPGQIAQDGPKGGHGVFTGALLAVLDQPGLSLEQVFKETAKRVSLATNGKQDPWINSSVKGDFIFNPGAAAMAATAPSRGGGAAELLFWKSVKDSGDRAAFQAYLDQYPTGTFAVLARLKLEQAVPQKQEAQGKDISSRYISKEDSVRPFIRAQGPAVRWKMQSAFGSGLPIFGEIGVRFANILRAETKGQINFNFQEPGTMAPTLKILDAVANGSIKVAFTSAQYHVGQETGLAVYGALPFGPDARTYAAWLETTGDRLANEDFFEAYGVHHMTCGVIGSENAGWFKRPISALSDLSGLRMRIFGLPAEIMSRLGAEPKQISHSKIYTALQRGTIDAAEFSTPYIDTLLNLDQVAKFLYHPSWHQPSTAMELLVNLRAWRGLSTSQQKLIQQVCADNVRFALAEDERRQLKTLDLFRSRDISPRPLPESIISAARREWQGLASDEARRSTVFGRAYKSLQSFR